MNLKQFDDLAIGSVIRDTKVVGLHAKKTNSGISWKLYYRTKEGRERRPKIGSYPGLTVTQAREIARGLLMEVAQGKDPSGEKRTSREAPTVKDMVDKYNKEHAPRKKTGGEDGRIAERYILPEFGNRKVFSIDYTDIAKLHRRMKKTPYQANRVVALLSKQFQLTERWGWRPQGSNPCRGVEKYREKKRKRYMAVEEAQAVAQCLDRHVERSPAGVAFIYLLILTGARLSEIAAAQWTDLDGGYITLEDSKNGEIRKIFLPEQAMKVIGQLPRTTGSITGIKTPAKLWQTVRVEAGCPDLRLHDLRHSFASAAISAGFTLAQIGELLGHKSNQTTHRYAHLMDEMAKESANVTGELIADRMGVTS